jgi:hypothetical protein
MVVLDGRMLFVGLLEIHMVLDIKENTIIYYLSESLWNRISTVHLQLLMQLVGESVYWQNIWQVRRLDLPLPRQFMAYTIGMGRVL